MMRSVFARGANAGSREGGPCGERKCVAREVQNAKMSGRRVQVMKLMLLGVVM